MSAWIRARATGAGSESARSQALSARSAGGNQAESFGFVDILIREELLQAYVVDIQDAEKRFVDSIDNPPGSSDQQDEVERVARKSIRTHLLRVLEHNGGSFPSAELQGLWTSCMCDELE